MAIILNEVYQKTKHQFKLRLVAGEGGLSHIMRWIYIAEDINSLSFLKGGELAISTGLALPRTNNWLFSFVTALIQHNACGLILNTGMYIHDNDITEEIYQLCNTYNFPLFIMPWEIFLSDISQTYSNYIFQDNQQIDAISNAFKTVMRYESQQPEATQLLVDANFHDTDSYFISVIEFTQSNQLSFSSCLESMKHHISSFLAVREIEFHMFDYKKRLILVWHKLEKCHVQALFEPLVHMIRQLPDISCLYMGIGSNLQGFSNLRTSYKQACAALIMASYEQCSYYDFEQFGVYQIFFSVSDKTLLRKLYEQKLGMLEQYDEQHQTSYVDTLSCYLKYNGKIDAMATAMICHRNTINYRLRHLREILNYNLEDGDVRFELQLAYSIRKYLDIFGAE